MGPPTGAHVIAHTLQELGVTVIFGLVGIPVADIAEEAINLGIRFIGLRNEQSCSYAATAYGYLTGKPGICLLVGGPGILHGMAGIGNASANAFPTLFLGGSSETALNTKGAFQEMDAISLLTPHTKTAIRPASNDPAIIASALQRAYTICWYGRPGPAFIDLPADLIMLPTSAKSKSPRHPTVVAPPPKPAADPTQIAAAAALLRRASSPLVVVGKGAAYSRAETAIRDLISSHHIPFLPTPMGKGIIADSHPLNTSSARSAALKSADVILLLGARLNWILHYGEPPKYRKDVKIIQVDISPEELGRLNGLGEPSLSIFADIGLVVAQLSQELAGWKALPEPSIHAGTTTSNPYLQALISAAAINEQITTHAALEPTRPGEHLTYERAYHIIKSALDLLSPPENGDIVYVSEGANTMDISRPAFPLSHPRRRLDAGTYATMGVGPSYAIAAWAAYNLPQPNSDRNSENNDTNQTPSRRKKIIALEGDSAIGFSAMEIETMARHKMDVLVFVMNNSGIYQGDTLDRKEWDRRQDQTAFNETALDAEGNKQGLRSTSLWYETRYELLAEMVGGKGYFVRTEAELERATREGFQSRNVVVVNVVIEPGLNKSIRFAWQQQRERESKL